MVHKLIILLLAMSPIIALSQPTELNIEEERRGNRVMLYGLNETLIDLEVTIEVSGTGFRQSKRKPRGVLIPAASKVHLLNLMVNKGETPKYTVKQKVSDSISRRTLKKQSIPIKIPTAKPIIMYVTENCTTCDSLVARLERSPYKYQNTYLEKDLETKKQIAKGFPRLDTIVTPIFNIKGYLNTEILNYEDVFEKFIKEEE
jgi:hypothetical protein